MKVFLRVLLRSAAFGAFLIGALAIWLNLTYVSAADLPPLRTGDIVFQEAGGSQALAISLASKSIYTHTGLIEMRDGSPFVVEAVGPVKSTPLAQWIDKGTAGRITIKRLKSLNANEAEKAIAAAHTHDGKPYDSFFYRGRDAIYCSELVHLAFKDGAGIEVGKEERVRDLNIDNAAVRALIKARWRQYPPCVAANARTYEQCYGLILEETLVTPASVARDAKLETVFTNFGPAAD